MTQGKVRSGFPGRSPSACMHSFVHPPACTEHAAGKVEVHGQLHPTSCVISAGSLAFLSLYFFNYNMGIWV